MRKTKKEKIQKIGICAIMVASIIASPSFVHTVSAQEDITKELTETVTNNLITSNITHNEIEASLPCEFKIVKEASDGQLGEVQVGRGVKKYPAIDAKTSGSIDIPETIDVDGKTYIVTSIGDYAFNNCQKLQTTGLADNTSVTSLGDYAYELCMALTRTGLESNNTITSTGTGVFKTCRNLISTGLESNTTLTSISDYMFSKCFAIHTNDGLKSTGLESNSTVTSIGDYAFEECQKLEDTGLANNETVVSIGNSTFSDCYKLRNTGLESNHTLTNMGTFVFSDCKALETTGLAENTTLTSIPMGTFESCQEIQQTGLKSNSTVTSIGNKAFYRCKSLKSTGLENNNTVTSIGKEAFAECRNPHAGTGLSSTGLEKNKTVTSIGVKAFAHTQYLNKLVFQNLVLPTMAVETETSGKINGVFTDSYLKIFYLPETVNPEVLENCGKSPVTKLNVTKINKIKQNTKLEYVEGETFDPSGLVIEVAYSEKVVQEREYDSDIVQKYFSFDKTTLTSEDEEVKLTYLGKTISIPINVTAKQIAKVEVKNAPAKVNYVEGQAFNPNGLELTVTYNDGDTEIVVYGEATKNDYVFTPTKLTTVGNQDITVTYLGKEVSSSITVTVKEKEIIDIEITKRPTIQEYVEGQEYDPNGLELIVSYDNGTTESIIYNEATKGDFKFDKTILTAKDGFVVITYKGKEILHKITVSINVSTEIPEKPNQGVDTSDSTESASTMALSLLIAGIMIIILVKSRNNKELED